MRLALIEHYWNEIDGDVRAVLVDELAKHAAEFAEVQELVIRALDDRHSWVRRTAARGIIAFRLKAALARVVNELESGDQDTRIAFVDALASFGSDAVPYTFVLERLLLLDLSVADRLHINRALERVRLERK